MYIPVLRRRSLIHFVNCQANIFVKQVGLLNFAIPNYVCIFNTGLNIVASISKLPSETEWVYFLTKQTLYCKAYTKQRLTPRGNSPVCK